MQVLGIDIGGSAIKGAPVDLTTGVLLSERLLIPTPQPVTQAAVAATITDFVRYFCWTGPIGCGLPAAVNNGIALTAANIDQSWIGTDTVELFSHRCGCPIAVVNDADAAGIAEMRYGAGRHNDGTVMLVTIGTGLGTALFRQGVLVPNTEFGHIHINGQVAEKIASSAARENLGLSLKEWALHFNTYLNRLYELLYPDLFIIGGEVSKLFDTFSRHLKVKADILPAQLRNDAGIVGAAAAAQLQTPRQ